MCMHSTLNAWIKSRVMLQYGQCSVGCTERNVRSAKESGLGLVVELLLCKAVDNKGLAQQGTSCFAMRVEIAQQAATTGDDDAREDGSLQKTAVE
jgi:hypothetical protein